MLAQITSRQLQEWRAYADIEPWDEERDDIRTASIVREVRDLGRTMAGVILRRSRPGKPPTLEECLLRWSEASSPEERAETGKAKALGALSMLVQLGRENKRAKGAKRPPAKRQAKARR